MTRKGWFFLSFLPFLISEHSTNLFYCLLLAYCLVAFGHWKRHPGVGGSFGRWGTEVVLEFDLSLPEETYEYVETIAGLLSMLVDGHSVYGIPITLEGVEGKKSHGIRLSPSGADDRGTSEAKDLGGNAAV